MRAEELRIGDWVKIDLVDRPARIGGIIPKHGTLFAYIEEIPILVPCDKLQAIPLTADLLYKNLFTPTIEDDRIYEDCNGDSTMIACKLLDIRRERLRREGL